MRRTKRPVPARVFTESMADISFLLVIFFMLTATFAIDRGLDFRLPDEPHPPQHLVVDRAIDIHVTNDGLVVDRQRMGPSELLPYIDRRLALEPGKTVLLRTDWDAQYGSMVATFDLLRQAPLEIGRDLAIAIPTRRDLQQADVLGLL